MHTGVIYLMFHCISLSSVCLSLCLPPTGAGGNPNSGSGFQSGVWILAGCQGRYAWSPPTTGVWRMSENVPPFPLLPPPPLLLLFSTLTVYISCLALGDQTITSVHPEVSRATQKHTFSCVFLVLALTPSRGIMWNTGDLFGCSCQSLLSSSLAHTQTEECLHWLKLVLPVVVKSPPREQKDLF